MYMRMQPWLAAVPIELEIGVPWMPMAEAEVPIQRVPRGLSTPGGTGPSPAAQGESGGNQVGLRCLVTMWKVPDGVGYAACPTAIPKVRRLPARQRGCGSRDALDDDRRAHGGDRGRTRLDGSG